MGQNFENKIKPTIVGGGIGGLSLAVGLQKRGIAFDLYEAATDINEVGAGIMLASNAMQVFKHFGIYEEVAKLGNHISQMRITDQKLKILSKIDLRPFEEKYGVHNVTIHRAVLQKKLFDLIDRDSIHLGKRLEKIELVGEGIVLDFGSGRAESELVIGADGIHSKVREVINSGVPKRRAFQKCWRGVTEFDLPKEYHQSAIEAWGKGSRFGLNRLNEKQVYWYALVNSKDMSDTLEGNFDDFDPLVSAIIEATRPDDIIENEIIDLKPNKNWFKGGICLMGDAGHATTPNMGQGACQAIEDAYVLSNLLSKHTKPVDAFVAFQKSRLSKAHQIVNRSWTIGKVSQLERSMLRTLRNASMRLMPNSMGAKPLEKVFELSKW